MSRLLQIEAMPRRLAAVLALAALAAIVAAALLMQPAPAPTSDRAAPAPAADPAAEIEPGTPLDGGSLTRETADAAAGAAAPEVSGGPSSTLPLPPIEARIIRTAAIELQVPRGKFEDTWGDAQAVAGAFGGIVSAASRTGSGKEARTGTISIRVPSGKFDDAVDRLRDLPGVKVERLDVASQDVTQEFVDVKSRLRHDRAVEGRLLALLADTTSVGEVLAVQARLDQVQEQIELSKGRLDHLARVTSMSTIELTLRETGARSPSEREGSVIGEAFSDARDRLLGNVAAAVVWLGGALPALLVLAVVALVAIRHWRRLPRGGIET